MALARAAKAKKREHRVRLERIETAKRFSPFAMLPPYDDLSVEHPVKVRRSKKLCQRRGLRPKARSKTSALYSRIAFA